MIWATVSSLSCFCWLYRASPSLAIKTIINLISVLTIWWCPCVESSLVLLEEGVCYDQCNISLCPASFHISRPNMPVTPGVSWLPTFVFQSPIMKRTSFLGVSSNRSCRSSRVLLLSRVQLFVTPWTVAYKALLFIGFSRQEYWSGLPFLSPGDLPNPGIKPRSPALQADVLPSKPPGKRQSHSTSASSALLVGA